MVVCFHCRLCLSYAYSSRDEIVVFVARRVNNFHVFFPERNVPAPHGMSLRGRPLAKILLFHEEGWAGNRNVCSPETRVHGRHSDNPYLSLCGQRTICAIHPFVLRSYCGILSGSQSSVVLVCASKITDFSGIDGEVLVEEILGRQTRHLEGSSVGRNHRQYMLFDVESDHGVETFHSSCLLFQEIDHFACIIPRCIEEGLSSSDASCSLVFEQSI